LRRLSWINKNRPIAVREVPLKIVVLLQWTKINNGKLPVKGGGPLMKKALPTSLLRKKPEKQVIKVAKLPMKKALLTSLLRKKPDKLDRKAVKLPTKKALLTSLLRKKPEKQAVRVAKLLMEKALQENPDKAVVRAVAVKALKKAAQQSPDKDKNYHIAPAY
jgi:hypothetical protein